MSIKTWRDEFYPVAARDVPKDPVEATKHSLQKWIGLRPDNLARHDVVLRGHEVREPQFNAPHELNVYISASSCALCVHYYGDEVSDRHCSECPLHQVRGGYPCDKRSGREPLDPWSWYSPRQDPEPMISWLEEALAYAEDPAPEFKHPGWDDAWDVEGRPRD
jgi:hypothetical protein